MAEQHPLTLYYTNTNPLSTSSDPSLPLLNTLRPEDQRSVTRFLRLPDRHMSLASNLLKYLFIHRAAKIPWSEILISRTAPPHKRPFWDSGTAPSHASCFKLGAAKAVEFNVSHQAGLVVLAGCATASPPSRVTTITTTTTPNGQVLPISSSSSNPASDPEPASPRRIGIDITCPAEPSRRGAKPITTPVQFSDWVDIFAEVFSSAEMEDMKSCTPAPVFLSSPPSSGDGASPEDTELRLIEARLRRFYTFWALKEAYIKMTGEALLAGWLRELEFGNVIAPGVAEEGSWGEVERGVQVCFRGRKVEGLRVEVVGFGREYVVAMVGRGLDGEEEEGQGKGPWLGGGMREVDIERHVRACAEGRCGCLDN